MFIVFIVQRSYSISVSSVCVPCAMFSIHPSDFMFYAIEVGTVKKNQTKLPFRSSFVSTTSFFILIKQPKHFITKQIILNSKNIQKREGWKISRKRMKMESNRRGCTTKSVENCLISEWWIISTMSIGTHKTKWTKIMIK